MKTHEGKEVWEVPEQRIVVEKRCLSWILGWEWKIVVCLRTRDERGGRDSDEVVVVPERWELKHDVVGCKCTCKGNGLTHELKDMFVCSVLEFNFQSQFSFQVFLLVLE